MKHIKNIQVLAIMVLMHTGYVVGQSCKADSLYLLSDGRRPDLYYLFQGPADLINSQVPDHGFASGEVRNTHGGFRRPMDAGTSTVYSLGSGGIKTFGKWRGVAGIQYRKQYDRKKAWSAVQDPYSDNPFIWADSNKGNWEADLVTANIGLSTRVGKRYAGGILVNYSVGTGARTNEPKPFFRTSHISLKPGLTRRLSPSATIGITGKAGFVKEENEIGYYSNDNVLLYRIRGYGTFSRSPFVSGERKRSGKTIGGTINYQTQKKNYSLVLAASGSQAREEVFEGISQKQITGYFTGYEFTGEACLFVGSSEKGKSIALEFENRTGIAEDIILRAENASYLQRRIAAHFSLWQSRRNGSWQLRLNPVLYDVDYIDQAARLQYGGTTAGATLAAVWQTYCLSALRLRIDPTVGYFHTINTHFSSGSSQTIIKELVVPHYQFLTSNFWLIGTAISFLLNPESSAPSHLLTANGQWRIANGNYFDQRTNYNLTYTILF